MSPDDREWPGLVSGRAIGEREFQQTRIMTAVQSDIPINLEVARAKRRLRGA